MEIKNETENILKTCIVKEEPSSTAVIELMKYETIPEDTSGSMQFVITEINEKIHKCSHCDKTFSEAYLLKNHILVHNDEKNYHCKLCAMDFKTKTNFNKHNSTHTKKISTCPICKKTFQHKGLLNNHLKTHKNKESVIKDIKCKQCDRKFLNNRNLKRHMVLIHSEADPQDSSKSDFTCRECGKMHWDREKLVRHMLVHSKLKNIQCPICPKKFKHQMYLDRHMDYHKSNRPYTCTICKLSFKTRENLNGHKILHTDEPKTCPYCKETFRNKLTLRGHIKLIHKGLPLVSQNGPHICRVCKELFENLDALKEHVRSHSDDGNFECGHCGRNFKRKFNMRQHILAVHLGQKRVREKRKYKPPKIRKYSCEHCDKKLQTKSHYLAHLTVHSNERPYKCNFCPTTFKHIRSLRIHTQNKTCRKLEGTLPIAIKSEKNDSDHLDELETQIEISETVKTETDCSVTIKSEFE